MGTNRSLRHSYKNRRLALGPIHQNFVPEERILQLQAASIDQAKPPMKTKGWESWASEHVAAGSYP